MVNKLPCLYGYIAQTTAEDIFGKHMSTYLSNPSGESLQSVLNYPH